MPKRSKRASDNDLKPFAKKYTAFTCNLSGVAYNLTCLSIFRLLEMSSRDDLSGCLDKSALPAFFCFFVMVGIVEQARRWAAQASQAEGCELVDLAYLKEGRDWILRVFIEKQGGPGDDGRDGVNLGICSAVSDRLAGLLDVHDVIPGAYRLEVSSPGLDRPLTRLEDYERFKGRLARIRTHQPVFQPDRDIAGRRRFRGLLKGLKDGRVLIEVDGERMEIPFEAIQKARLDFDVP